MKSLLNKDNPINILSKSLYYDQSTSQASGSTDITDILNSIATSGGVSSTAIESLAINLIETENLTTTNLTVNQEFNFSSILQIIPTVSGTDIITQITTIGDSNIQITTESPNNYIYLGSSNIYIAGQSLTISSSEVNIYDPIITHGYFSPSDPTPSYKGFGFDFYYIPIGGGSTKHGFVGYSQDRDRFVFYDDCNISVSQSVTRTSGTTNKFDLDIIYTNIINSADDTTSSLLEINGDSDINITSIDDTNMDCDKFLLTSLTKDITIHSSGSSANSYIQLGVNSKYLKMNQTQIFPTTNLQFDLGTPSLGFDTCYFETVYVNGLTPSSNVKVDANGQLITGGLDSNDITGVIDVAHGGTGRSTLTNNSVLIGNVTADIDMVDMTGNGKLLIGRNSNIPVAATLTAGTGINITNGSGSITISVSGGGGGIGTFDAIELNGVGADKVTIEGALVNSTFTISIPDVGVNSDLVLTQGNQDIDGIKTFIGATLDLTGGTANKVSLDSSLLTADYILTIPDVGTNSELVLTQGNQDIDGIKTFIGATLDLTGGTLNKVSLDASLITADYTASLPDIGTNANFVMDYPTIVKSQKITAPATPISGTFVLSDQDITLNTGVATGTIYYIRNTSTINSLTITPPLGETIAGGSSVIPIAYTAIICKAEATIWYMSVMGNT